MTQPFDYIIWYNPHDEKEPDAEASILKRGTVLAESLDRAKMLAMAELEGFSEVVKRPGRLEVAVRPFR
jgi:hypothetical protein